MNNIHRGDIYYIDNAKYIDAIVENSPARPAIIVSNNKCNAFSNNVTVVYLTTNDSRPDLPTHVPIYCKKQIIAMCESVSMIDAGRIGNYVRTCTTEEMKAIDNALKIQLAIEETAEGIEETAEGIEETAEGIEETAEGIARDENIRLKATLEVYKELVTKLLPQLA